jgi:DNA topoisomerase-3
LLPDNRTTEITWDGEKTFSQGEAINIKKELESIREMIVTDFSAKEGTRGRPEALNTVHLLKVASSNLGIGP